MVSTSIERAYLSELIKHCSNFRLDGLPAMGEMFYQNITLEDIYAPLRLSESKETEDILKWGASISDLVEKQKKQGEDYIDEETLGKIDEFFATSDTYEEASDPFSQLIAFIDAQLRKPAPSANSEIDSFIFQLDTQIRMLSTEDTPHDSDEVVSVATPQEFIEVLDRRLNEPVNSLVRARAPSDNGELDFAVQDLVREYDDKPVGPLLKDRPSRKVILSNPGCGKTTLAKRISLAYASGNKKGLECYSLPGNLFPVLLYCRTINGDKFGQDDCFLDMAYHMTKKTFDYLGFDKVAFADTMTSKAVEGKLLLVIDGFDELFLKENREMFAKALFCFLVENPNVHLLLTSRIASFVNLDRSDDVVIELINSIPGVKYNIIPAMDQEEIEAFIRRWHNVLFPFDSEKTVIAESIIAQLRQPAFDYLKKMTCIPLHLSNILLVARTSNRIPNNKVQLYEDYLSIALNWHATGRIETEDMEIQLAYVAYHMMKKGIQRISKKMLVDVLLQCYKDLDGEFRVPMDENNVEQFIMELEERTCVLKKSFMLSGEDIYQFTHLNLQEYLAAYAIAKGCSEDLKTSLEVISERYKRNAWREVIILTTLLTNNRSERNAIIDYLINEAETNEDNYHATNLLFELGTLIRTNRKHAIYDLLFKEHITDYQIKKICEFMEDSRSEEFKQYVSEKFSESFSAGDSNYAFAIATIWAFECLQSGKNPLEEAEHAVISKNLDAEWITSLYVFVVIGWCKYCKINHEFATMDIILSPEFGNRIRGLILTKTQYLGDIAIALKDIVLAEYLLDFEFLDVDVFHRLILMLSDEKDKLAAERILSVFPLNFRTLGFNRGENLDALRAKYIAKYRQHIQDGTKAEETVFSFSLCMILGCWDFASNELLNEFTDLEGYYSLNKSQADDAARAKLKILQRQLFGMPDPVSAGLDYYGEGDFEGAKAAFSIAYEKGNTTVSNNLAYMLRRKEISEVVIAGKQYDVYELLKSGVIAGEPFSVINYALFIANQGNSFDYQAGLDVAKTMNMRSHASLKDVHSWWRDVAKNGEKEGIVVLAWLMELGIINNSEFGTLKELKSKI